MPRSISRLVAFSLLVLFSSLVQAKDWIQGIHYSVYNAPKESLDETVVEWFWIGSPQSASLEPILGKWKQTSKPEGVDFIQIPAAFNRTWEAHAKFVYVLQSTGVLEKPENREILYEMTDQDGPYANHTGEELAQEFGTSMEEAQKKVNSQEFMQNVVQRDMAITKHYRREITGVPYLVVEGKYIINFLNTDNVKQAEVPSLINHLLALDE